MKKILTVLTIGGMSVLMANCSAKKTASATKTPEQIVAEVKSKYSDEQMNEGKTIFQESCNKCHPLKEPETRTVDKWERVLPRMSERSKLDAEQAGKVRAYVLAHAKV
ncbi:MAG: hypothetical protein KDC11_03485 [Chitinophagaceae bacterium]|nr:hypothetical protein [Chitinophagaceae bacterium]